MDPRVSFVSLGCPKNLVDSEKMLGLLAEAGCAVVGEGGAADVMVVNTCGFLAASRDEAVAVLSEAAERKRRGEIRGIVAAGCLVQRDGAALLEAVPEIDALVGVNDRERIVQAVREISAVGTRRASARGKSKSKGASGNGTGRRPVPRGGELTANSAGRTVFLGEYHPQSWSDRARLRLTPRHYAYLRMSEGCNQKCTFCTIPSIRGLMNCKPVEEIVAEARELIADGAREINLIGQDTTSYESTLGGAAAVAGGQADDTVDLAGLLRVLNRLDGAGWIRLMYAYPSDFTDEMIDALAECERVVKYVDMPLQHINDRLLKAMHRRVTRRQTERLLAKLRERVPGLSIRTTFIAGFPGETEAEFAELVEFVRDFGFDMVGVFPYSLEPDTPAGRMKGQLADEVKQSRVAALMEAQQQVAFGKAAAERGRVVEVMIDGFGRDGVYPARHTGQAPEIDSTTFVEGGEFNPGEIARVRITGHRGYDLLARPVQAGLPILHAHGAC